MRGLDRKSPAGVAAWRLKDSGVLSSGAELLDLTSNLPGHNMDHLLLDECGICLLSESRDRPMRGRFCDHKSDPENVEPMGVVDVRMSHNL